MCVSFNSFFLVFIFLFLNNTKHIFPFDVIFLLDLYEKKGEKQFHVFFFFFHVLFWFCSFLQVFSFAKKMPKRKIIKVILDYVILFWKYYIGIFLVNSIDIFLEYFVIIMSIFWKIFDMIFAFISWYLGVKWLSMILV